MAWARASRAASPLCSCSASMIWAPTVMTGLRAVMGSWKITAISLPRRACSSAGPMASTSRPWKRMAALQPGGVEQAQGGQGGDRLARARLAHQGQLLARAPG